MRGRGVEARSAAERGRTLEGRKAQERIGPSAGLTTRGLDPDSPVESKP